MTASFTLREKLRHMSSSSQRVLWVLQAVRRLASTAFTSAACFFMAGFTESLLRQDIALASLGKGYLLQAIVWKEIWVFCFAKAQAASGGEFTGYLAHEGVNTSGTQNSKDFYLVSL